VQKQNVEKKKDQHFFEAAYKTGSTTFIAAAILLRQPFYRQSIYASIFCEG